VITPDGNFQKHGAKKDNVKTQKSREPLNISVAVIPKGIVDSYLSIFKKANIQPVVFEIESMGVIRSLISNSFSPCPVVIVDIGKCGTGLTIFSGRTILFTSHIDICGQDFNGVISKNLKISLVEAERFKKEIGLVKIDKSSQDSKKEFLPRPEWKIYHIPVIEKNKSQKKKLRKELAGGIDLIKAAKADQIFSALVPILTDLTEQIQHYIDYFKDFKKTECVPDGMVKKIILCGGESRLIGLTNFISSSLKLPVELGNPLINVSPFKSIFPNNNQRQALPYATVIGLAIKGVE